MDTTALRRLVEIVVEHNLAELDLETEGVRINIKGASAAVAAAPVQVIQAPHAVAAPVAPAPAKAPAAETKADSREGKIALESPMVGVFYRAASPNDPAFVNIGDTIRIGQSIGLIEAMKVYSEVPAEKAGRVVEILVDNGKLVHMGDPLMYLEPL
jgi:acetyl-CoA carboxylase biotin carboxyl carrier protein